MRKYLFTIAFLFLAFVGFAQDTAAARPEGLRADEKIYVVIAVLIVILAGLFAMVIRLDRKISRLEKTEGLRNK